MAPRKTAPRQVPAKMKAAAVDRFGPPSELRTHTLPVPEPGPGEVLIELHAAGVGSWDAAIREGRWRAPGRPRFPLTPGVDGAGIVIAKGAGVRRLRVGDRVYAYEFGNPKGGFYAEYVVTNAENVGRVPDELDMIAAAAAASTAVTALQGIDGTLKLKRGETILIFGATGAVGTLALQFAKRRGARVIATATGRAASRLVGELGADAAVDARSDGFRDQLRAAAPDGIDAILALAGGAKLEEAIDLLRPGGRVAFPRGVEPEPRRRGRMRPVAYDGVPDPRLYTRLARAVAEAKLQVPIDKVYPLAQARRAHERLAKGQILGRMVVHMPKGG